MSFTGDHDVVETLSPDRANQPFSVRILPRRSRRGWVVAYAHRAETLEEEPTIEGITIPNQMSGRFLPRECLGQLLGYPLRCGMRRDVDPNEIATGDPDDDDTATAIDPATPYFL